MKNNQLTKSGPLISCIDIHVHAMKPVVIKLLICLIIKFNTLAKGDTFKK